MWVLMLTASSAFWEFNDAEFDEKINDSYAHPIFAACYTDYCPHCVGVPKALRDYATSLGDNTNVVFTTINCGNTERCAQLQIRGVPGFRFLRGRNPRYWLPTSERGLPGWADFLYKVNGPPLHKVDSPSEREEPLWGSTSFHLSVYDSDEFLNEYRRVAEDLRIFGCTFAYSLESVENPTLTAFLSGNCHISIVPKLPGDIKTFVERYKFSISHRYDSEEFEHRDKVIPLALVVSDDTPIHQHFAAIDKLAKKYCGEVKFGWATTADEVILNAFNRPAEDAPFLGVINDRQRLNISTKKKFADADRSGLFETALGIGSSKGFVAKVTLGVILGYAVVTFWVYLAYVRFCGQEGGKQE
jgi:hypothetical protein